MYACIWTQLLLYMYVYVHHALPGHTHPHTHVIDRLNTTYLLTAHIVAVYVEVLVRLHPLIISIQLLHYTHFSAPQ